MSKAKKKGRSQADGTRRSYFVFDPAEVIIIGLDTKDGPEHPLFDGESNAHAAEKDAANIANVRTFGVLEPILFERDGNRILVVDGRTRVRWARAAAKLQKSAGEEVLVVPGLPKRGDGAMLYGISRAANTHRPDDTPLQNARNAQRLMDMGRSEPEVAVAFGVTPQTMKQWLALLQLDPKVQRAVERGMAVGAAAPLAKLPKAEQVAKLAELGSAKPTARAVANKLRADQGKPARQTPAHRLREIEVIINDLARDPEFDEEDVTVSRRAIVKIGNVLGLNWTWNDGHLVTRSGG